MMKKYSTYRVFENQKTGEIIRKAFEKEEELEKYASSDQWKELEEDPNLNEE